MSNIRTWYTGKRLKKGEKGKEKGKKHEGKEKKQEKKKKSETKTNMLSGRRPSPQGDKVAVCWYDQSCDMSS